MNRQSRTNGVESHVPLWAGPARVMACVGYNPASQLLIRRAGQLARAFAGELIAVHIQTAASAGPGYRTMLDQNMALAHQLGRAC